MLFVHNKCLANAYWVTQTHITDGQISEGRILEASDLPSR